MTMNKDTGYIYVRCHSAYDEYDACKMGMTNSIPEERIF
jgi:hypothetical protein